MARYNIVKNIRKRKIIILVVLLILIMVSWLIWGNLSVETNINNNSDYLQKARKYGHFTGYKN